MNRSERCCRVATGFQAGPWRAALWILLIFLISLPQEQAKSTQDKLAPASSASAGKPAILVVGDSISAEYGLPRDSGWVKMLASKLDREGFDYSVVNASISGETTSGGRSRLAALLQSVRPAIVVIELGGNDGLRGLPPAGTEENLARMIEAAQATKARVLLIGMELPPNYGRAFTERFAHTYSDLASRYPIALLPFFFEGFADRLDAFQADRIHPRVESQSLLLANVWPKLKPLLLERRVAH